MNEEAWSDAGGWTADSATIFGFLAKLISLRTLGSRRLPWQLVVEPTGRQTSLLKIENPAMVRR